MSQFRIKNGLIIDNGGIAVTGSISSTAGITGSFSGSIAGFPTDVAAFSSSLSSRIASNEAKTGSYATTGSNQFNGSQTVTGSLTATGTIVAQTLVVQTITSSVEFVTGSNRFGTTTGNTHEFTGSLLVSGSQTVTGNATFSNDLYVVESGNALLRIQASTNTTPVTDIELMRGTNTTWGADGYGDYRFRNSGGDLTIQYGDTGVTSDRLVISSSGVTVFNGVSASPAITLANTTGGTKTDFTITENTGLIINSYEGASARSIDLKVGGASALTIASSQAATFAGSVTINGESLTIGGTTNNAVINNIASVRINIDSDNNGTGESFIIGHNQTNIDNNNVLFKVQDNGNIGIGTTSPTYVLDVRQYSGQYWNGSAFTGTPTAIAMSNTVPGGYDPVFLLQQTDSGGTVKNAGAIGMVGTAAWTAGNNSTQVSDMYFLIRNDSGSITERMRIKSTGNVGIGTASPGTKLHVVGGNDNTLIIDNDGSTYTSAFWRNSNNNRAQIYFQNSAKEFGIGTLDASGYIAFSTAVATERMRITSGGNLGIGTSSPNARLDLGPSYGASGEKFFIYNDNSSSALAGTKVGFYMDRFGLSNNSTYVFPTSNANPGSYIIASKDTSSTTLVARMTVLGESGNVGIGTTSPSNPENFTRVLNISSTNAALVLSNTSGTTKNWSLGAYEDGSFRIVDSNSQRFKIDSVGRISGTVNTVNGQFQLFQTDAAYSTDAMMYLMNNRNATSGYNFAKFFSGYPDNTSDIEFAFRGDGIGYSDGGWTTPASDYAEYFESIDGTALQIGTTVVLENGKIRQATESDTNIIGVIRPKNASLFLGNNAEHKWNQKYLKDDFGAYILDTEGMRTLNPDYDPDIEYIPREKRDEWNIVGLVGQVPTLKSQPKNPNWVKMHDVSDTVEMWLIK